MRRLTAAVAACVAAPAVVVTGALTGCGASGAGVRLEGSPTAPAPTRAAETAPEAGAPASPEGSPKAADGGTGEGSAAYTENGEVRRDGETRLLSVIRRDPKVSAQVKQDLEPCVGDLYPVNVTYGRATGAKRTDLVVNVTSCADSVGVGTYVYRRSSSGSLVNVFAAERPPVHSEITGEGFLIVTRDVFLGDEPMCCPSGRDIITYVWQDGVFREVARKRTDSASSPAPGDDEGPSD